MTSRRRVTVWVGVGLAVAGGAVALVAWVGLDQANGYLGVSASVAALLGLGLAVWPLKAPDSCEGEDGRGLTVDQWGKASGGGQVRQVGADSSSPPGSGPRGSGRAGGVKQRGKAKGAGSRVEQVGGDRTVGGEDAGQA
jgi:hypothetical protein